MTASLQAETTNQVIDQISLTKRTIDQILDRTMDEYLQQNFEVGTDQLVKCLGKISNQYSPEVFKNWIRDYCLAHPVADFLLKTPVNERCYQKPKGYAGDALLIDYFYRKINHNFDGSIQTERLNDSLVSSTSGESVRERAKYFGNLITQISESKKRKISAISIASGHLRELDHVSHFEDKVYHFIGLDQDAESNTEARRSYPFKGLTVLDESIKYVLAGKLEAESYDLVYSAGLFDYLDEKVAARMTKRMFELVVPGGTMVIPNFAKGIIERGYMETFMDWYLIYRDEMELYGFMKELDMSQVASWNIHGDKYGNILYLTVVKKG
jgi:extracellular factor (EF) 3-hydroxypalmitic acid methyl ester biosynthesis protein